MTPEERTEWVRANSIHLRPEDGRLVSGYDPFTRGLVLLQLNAIRTLEAAILRTMFGQGPS